MAEFAEMTENDYGIKRKGTTVQNPKENMDEENSWEGILATTQATPMQLVFGHKIPNTKPIGHSLDSKHKRHR
jgi:hypothetical protein